MACGKRGLLAEAMLLRKWNWFEFRDLPGIIIGEAGLGEWMGDPWLLLLPYSLMPSGCSTKSGHRTRDSWERPGERDLERNLCLANLAEEAEVGLGSDRLPRDTSLWITGLYISEEYCQLCGACLWHVTHYCSGPLFVTAGVIKMSISWSFDRKQLRTIRSRGDRVCIDAIHQQLHCCHAFLPSFSNVISFQLLYIPALE